MQALPPHATLSIVSAYTLALFLELLVTSDITGMVEGTLKARCVNYSMLLHVRRLSYAKPFWKKGSSLPQGMRPS